MTTAQEATLEQRLDREIKRLTSQQWKEKFGEDASVTTAELINWLEYRLNHWLARQKDALPGMVDMTPAQQKRVKTWLQTVSGASSAAADDDDDMLDEELGLTDDPAAEAATPPAVSQPAQPAVATRNAAAEAEATREFRLATAVQQTRDDLALGIAGVGQVILDQMDAIASRTATTDDLSATSEAVTTQIAEVGAIASLAATTDDLNAMGAAVAAQIAELKRMVANHDAILDGLKADLRLVHGGSAAAAGVLAEQHQKITKILALAEGKSETAREGRAFAAPATPSSAEADKRSDNGRKKK